jgi:DNA-binding FadR family transcriptional regulator
VVARDLAAYIVDSGLTRGTTLPTERAMAQSLSVGRTTMREALRLLETRGVLTIRSGPGGGPVVRRPRPSDLAESLTLMLQFEASTFREVMEARTLLEPSVTRSAASTISKRVVADLREANEAMRASASTNDTEAFSEGNRRFHSIIAENCGNMALRIFAETLLSIGDGRGVGISYAKRQILAIAESHDKIIEALARRDPGAAEAAMRAHLEEATTYWKRRFGDVISRPVRWTQ